MNYGGFGCLSRSGVQEMASWKIDWVSLSPGDIRGL